MRSRFFSAVLAAALALLAGACGDDPNPVEPPTTGSLTITVETVGSLPDPNGYQVTRTGAAPLDLPVNGSVRLDSVAPGSYSFALGKASLYCTVENGATRDAQVVAGQSAQVTFRVRCERNGLAYLAASGPPFAIGIAFPGRDPVTLVTGVATTRFRFSPDRRRIAYAAAPVGGGPQGIFTVDLDSLQVTRVTPEGSPIRSHPEWSPDGTRIAYVTASEIRVIRPGETAETTIWRAPAGFYPAMPTWSPDGSRIAFVRAPNDVRDITRVFAINPDGTGEQEMATLRTHPYLQIDWSPDGRTLAYSDGFPGQPSAIYAANYATGVETRVAFSPDRIYRNVTFLPDGRIGFFSQAYPDGTLLGNLIANVDGTGLTQVSIPGLAAGAPIVAWQ
jgi:WD40 repeat protein